MTVTTSKGEGATEELEEGKAPSKGSGESSKYQTMKEKYSALKPFVIISSSYLLFTITDGGLRMIVLLHAYTLGFSAMEAAVLFTLYELAGVVTNLLAGIMGARWGIRATLLSGLLLQVLGIGSADGLAGTGNIHAKAMTQCGRERRSWKGGRGVIMPLANARHEAPFLPYRLPVVLQDEWGREGSRWKGMLYIIIAQMWAGIAKDLTKLGGKTVTKLVTPDEQQSKLFKLVSFITGFKNSLKGLGYFLGSALVAVKCATPFSCPGLPHPSPRSRGPKTSL